MNDRLEQLRFALGLEWGELAEKLDISRAMLGFIRRGDRKPSAKLALKIRMLEKGVCSNPVASDDIGIDWKQRALDAEEKLMRVQRALKHALKGFEELQEAVK